VPVKLRTAKTRRLAFSAEMVDLFVELEGTPEHQRHTRKFKDAEHELMRRLHLVSEFWSMNSPLDRGGPCHPEGHLANRDWQTCRRIRRELLAAARMQFGGTIVPAKENAPAQADGGEESGSTTRRTVLHN
jgi:hypothetical protein